MLLALTSASNVGWLHNLDRRLMTRTENNYSVHFNKSSKSWRQNQKLPVLEFLSCHGDKDLCVVIALDGYLQDTSDWRKANNHTQSSYWVTTRHIKKQFLQKFLNGLKQHLS